MHNEAKVGMVLGVGVVMAVAVNIAPHGSTSSPSPRTTPPASLSPAPARPTTQTPPTTGSAGARRYTVQPGDTLAGLAERYYGDRQKSGRIVRANRDVLRDSPELSPGIELTIPDLGDPASLTGS